MPDAEVEGAARFRNIRLDDLLFHGHFPISEPGCYRGCEGEDHGRKTRRRPRRRSPAADAPSSYPPDLAAKIGGREKRVLGDLFRLRNFGVNLTRLPPGAASALRHAHARQDEFVYILAGHPVLRTDAGETPLSPGMCAGFPAGTGNAHCLVNPGPEEVLYLEVGDRSPGDAVTYPDDDLKAEMGEDGKWRYSRKDGTPL